MDVWNVIANNGFAIAACVGMAFYVRELTKDHRKDINDIMAQHREETDKMTTAIQNNTLIVQRLLDTLETEVKNAD